MSSKSDVATQLSRCVEHLNYLHDCASGASPGISMETANLAVRVWFQVWDAMQLRLPVPAACSGPDGQMFYAWNNGRHHLELEIIPTQPAEWFYRDRDTETSWGCDQVIGEVLPDAVVGVLELFC